MNRDSRSLKGLRLGISISESNFDFPYRGGDRFVNDLTVKVASTWLNAGGQVALGHRWDPGGIMQQIAHWAREFQWIDWEEKKDEIGGDTPQILNLLAWPDVPPRWDSIDRDEFAGILECRVVKPPGISTENFTLDSSSGTFARVRALTAMRKELATLCQARICIGGGSGKLKRRLPGVIEEALFTFKAGKPLYISGALGGASKAMADAVLQRRLGDEGRALFFTPSSTATIIEREAGNVGLLPEEAASTETGWNALHEFQSIPISQLAKQSGLLEQELLNLLTTPEPQRALGWVIAGMGRLKASGKS